MQHLKTKPRAVIDLETSGLIPGYHEVLEVGIIKEDPLSVPFYRDETLGPIKDFHFGKGKRCLTVKIKPLHIDNAQPKAMELNGYNEEDWKDAVSTKEAAPRIDAFLRGCVVCGYNLKFDMGFLEQLFRGVGVKPSWSFHQVDVAGLAYEHLAPCGIEQLSLKAVCEFLGIPPEPETHRALNGAERCLNVMDKLLCATWFDRLVWKLKNQKRMELMRTEWEEQETVRKLKKASPP